MIIAQLELGPPVQDQTESYIPYERCVDSLTSPANQYREDAGDGA